MSRRRLQKQFRPSAELATSTGARAMPLRDEHRPKRSTLIGRALDERITGRLAARVYTFFLVFHDNDGRVILPHVPRIARDARVREDVVWELFALYLRAFGEPWRA